MPRPATNRIAARPLPQGWMRRRRSKETLATLAANATENVVRILWGGRIFFLSRPIQLSVRRRGPYWFTGYERLGVVGYGRDEKEALRSFADVFSATWDAVGEASDAALGGEARQLKRKLRALVADVQRD